MEITTIINKKDIEDFLHDKSRCPLCLSLAKKLKSQVWRKNCKYTVFVEDMEYLLDSESESFLRLIDAIKVESLKISLAGPKFNSQVENIKKASPKKIKISRI